MNAFSGEFETNYAELASGWASALRAASLRIYRRDFSSFVKVPSPPGKQAVDLIARGLAPWVYSAFALRKRRPDRSAEALRAPEVNSGGLKSTGCKGEKVADRPDERVIRGLVCPESPNSDVLCTVRGFTRRADAQPLTLSNQPRSAIVLALGLLFIALTPAAKADSPAATVTSKTSATTVQVAEPFTLELTVTAPEGTKVDFPSIGESLGEFDVTDQLMQPDVPSANDLNERTWTQRLTLESIVTGELEIPSLEILIRRGTEIQSLRTETIPLRITSILEDRTDPTKFRDIQTVVDIDVPDPVSRTWIWWTLGGSGGIVAAALLVIAATKRKTWITPSAWALRELDQLRQSEVMRNSDSERVIEALTTILRDYLELQFEIASPMQTTNEVLHAIETNNLMSAELAREFAALLENADLARFAGLQLSSAELNKTIEDAERLVGRGHA